MTLQTTDENQIQRKKERPHCIYSNWRILRKISCTCTTTNYNYIYPERMPTPPMHLGMQIHKHNIT